MRDALRAARDYFAVREDPYAGADMGNARRLGLVLWALLTALLAVTWVSSPPNEAMGDAGWIPALCIVAAAAVMVTLLARGKVLTTWNSTLVAAYGAVAAIGVLQWLAGGVGSPNERLCILPVLYVGMLHPPRRIAAFMGFVILVVAAPFVYDGWNREAAGESLAMLTIWSCLAVLGSILMTGVRAQRLALADQEATARKEARVDKLTGLPNRRAFDEALDEEVDRARRDGTRLTVAMVDLHYFKEVNDSFGHAEGDRCLRVVGQALAASVREPDMCFRWGGDEFALILAGTGASAAAPLGARLKGEIYSRCRRPDDEPMEIAFAVAELADGMPASELNQMAGMALTAEKAREKELEQELKRDLEDRL